MTVVAANAEIPCSQPVKLPNLAEIDVSEETADRMSQW